MHHVLISETEAMGIQTDILYISMSYYCFLCSHSFAFLGHYKSRPVGYLQVKVGTNSLLRVTAKEMSKHNLKLVFEMCRQPE